MIKANEGMLDRTIRVVVGLVFLGVGFVSLTGVAQIAAFVFGAAAFITGALGFCGLYALLGINTCPVKPKSK